MKPESRFLFVGDDVTAAGRSSEPQDVGTGYVRFLRDFLRSRFTRTAPVVLNRGVTDNRITDLAVRWEHDVIAQRPQLVSILIGVEDESPRPPSPDALVPIDQFRAVFRHILVQTGQALPKASVVLCQPVAAWSASPAEDDEILRPYSSAVLELASEFNAIATVPFHSAIVYARRSRPDFDWLTPDGRLTSAGHMMLAYTWLEELGLLPRAVS